MTPVEKLEAAISVLDTQRALAAVGVWGPVSQEESDDGSWAHYKLGEAVTLDADFNSAVDRFSAELIVTLHRTIDAQMELLRASLSTPSRWDDQPESVFVALADAILGGERQ